MSYVESVGKNVRRNRLRRGWSQQELAERSGLSPGHISEIENGSRKHLQVKTIKRLAKGLDVDVAVLLDEEGVRGCV